MDWFRWEDFSPESPVNPVDLPGFPSDSFPNFRWAINPEGIQQCDVYIYNST
jgi:hypothetical protein